MRFLAKPFFLSAAFGLKGHAKAEVLSYDAGDTFNVRALGARNLSMEGIPAEGNFKLDKDMTLGDVVGEAAGVNQRALQTMEKYSCTKTTLLADDFDICSSGNVVIMCEEGQTNCQMIECPSKEPSAVPSSSPSVSPSAVPSVSTAPSSTPSSMPSLSSAPSSSPSNIPSAMPSTMPTPAPISYVNAAPPVVDGKGGMLPLLEGVNTVSLCEADTFCGIFIEKDGNINGDGEMHKLGSLIPYTRSYDGHLWEAAPGPLAAPSADIDCTLAPTESTCDIALPPLANANDRYVILSKDGTSTEKNEIAKFLEMTTFGPTKSEINAFEAGWITDAEEARASYLRQQMDLPMSSHREYFRRRANTKWDASSIPGKSDHPCDALSKWRKYTFIPQDRHHTLDSTYLYTSFEVVPEEASLSPTIYEADSAADVTFDRGSFTGTRSYHSGAGYYDMSGQDDFVQWDITDQPAGTHPISFRYAQGSTGNNGMRPLDLIVNGVTIVSNMDFTFTDSWSYWRYTELVEVTFVEGTNTIKLLVNNGYGGPNIDHLRIGKPAAVVIKTAGWPRTIAQNGVGLLDKWGPDLTTGEYYMPSYADPPQGDLFRYIFGRSRFFVDGASKYLDIGNPPINFSGYEQYLPSNYFTFTTESFITTTDQKTAYPMIDGQEFLLQDELWSDPTMIDICNAIPPFAEEYDAPVFGKLPNGEWIQWTPTLALEDNGPSINAVPGTEALNTMIDGGGATAILTGEKTKCANVARSVFNEQTCVLSTDAQACTSDTISGEVMIPMNTSNVIALYETAGHYVYAIRGLATEGKDEHPCSKTDSRWEVDVGVTCPNPTVLQPDTVTSLSGMLTTASDTNAFIKDVTRTLACDPSDHDNNNDERDIQIQIGADCYKHVHPDHLNVYDFSGWTDNHPGGAYNIQKWAQGWEGHPGWYLNFPYEGNSTRSIPQHPMSRWYNNANVDGSIVYIARLGDEIAFRDLPNDLKIDPVAEYFGALSESVTGATIVCGSIGEVSNDPWESEVFEVLTNEQQILGTDKMDNQKHVVWTEVNLAAADQLRQRMAWALSQLLTIVPANIDASKRSEIYLAYYDILVRHAFGNYRDLLKEVSFSPLMAEHLSFLKSKSHSYVYQSENKRISRADENFAREVMQLFSIGLIKLNEDGTPQLDGNGNVVETYTNEDIESFARAWTGFDRTPARGNVEENNSGSTSNRLDPLKIVADYRDPFPKSDLNGGFIGDNYVLCEDLPDQAFLKKGARYRLLGGTSEPELIMDTSYMAKDSLYNVLRAELNATHSQLYQRLYNGGSYELLIDLETDLVCHGFECDVDTLRVVKVGDLDIYYEYVQQPCVQMAFYDNGKQIQLRDNYRRGQMCANPSLPHGREACCKPEWYKEVRTAKSITGVTYFYDGERMTYDTAESRCGHLCPFESVTVVPDNEWWRKGYHWTSSACGINVKVNSDGYVAIVHDVTSSNKDTVPWLVEEANTLNWFRVHWDGGVYPDSTNCEAFNCMTVNNACLCKTSVVENAVFSGDVSSISKQEILSSLFVGAIAPQSNSVETLGAEFKAYIVNGIIDETTTFEVEDKGRVLLLKNIKSTVSVAGWERTPEIFEAENAQAMQDVTVLTHSTASGGSYVDYGSNLSYLEWNVSVEVTGTYKLSFRYANDAQPLYLAISVNGAEVTKAAANPTVDFINTAGNPSTLPLQRCEGDCDNDDDCMDGLYCVQNDAKETVPGCGGTQNNWDYCADPADFTQGMVFYPTGGWNADWLMTSQLEVALVAGQNNVIRAQIPDGYDRGPNIDYMKIEGLTSTVSSSFRNPPHFMSLIPDTSPNGLGEQTLRDALYETDAVLDHYFYQDNVAPFVCSRIIQRFGISNPSPRYVSECSKAFKSGTYVSGLSTFGDGNYGNLEAVAAAVILDREATSSAIAADPGYGSVREPILKVMALLRSLEYQTSIPQDLLGYPMHDEYQIRLWEMDRSIGQSPFEFPTVFSFFLPEYVPDGGPALAASFSSPETQLLTMPNSLALLNGMYSLIKYGLSDCNGGFSLDPGYGSCNDNGQFESSFGHLNYQHEGSTPEEIVSDLSIILTAGRLSSENHAIILDACSTESGQAFVRCAQQLIVSTGEFHTTSQVTQSDEGRALSDSVVASAEPYKAIVYLYLSGGCDSHNMLAPYTCDASNDVYEKYREIRGKSDISEGIGLPKERLQSIATTGQTCSHYGIHEQLTKLKQLYDDDQAIFIANAGLLATPVDIENYKGETPVQLFAHNAMTLEAQREDLFEEYGGTGVGGRIADVLTQMGIPSSTFSIDGQQILLTGETGEGPTQLILSDDGLPAFNEDPSISNMNEVIQSLNNATTSASGFHAETWSSKLAEAMARQAQLKQMVDAVYTPDTFPEDNGLADELRIVTRLMQTADERGSKRDIFYVSDGGYDTHSNVDASLVTNFARLNAAISAFVTETQRLTLWESTTLVQFSEFARTLDPNTGDGSDHGWGGVHFMIGGDLNGGKVLGQYPDEFVDSPIALSRGRMIPTTPWDAMWYGTAQWFGVNNADMTKVLPMHGNFDLTNYGKEDLFQPPVAGMEEGGIFS